MKKKLIIYICLLFVFTLSACENTNYKYINGKVNIVATTTMLGDLFNEIGGDLVSITTLMTVGVDPHTYNPKPSDTQAITKCDLIVINGLHLEAQMGEVLQHYGEEKLIVVGDYVDNTKLLKDSDNQIDPHIWFDTVIWANIVKEVGKKLIEFDKQNEKIYQNKIDTYYNKIMDKHEELLSKVSELPIEKRILVTAHDAFQYFSKAYGFKVHAIQGISTETEASSKDIQKLADYVVENKVKSIFIESSVPKSTIKSVVEACIAKNHTVIIGGTLFSDSLGSESENAETYIKMITKNMSTIVDALK